MGWAGNSSGGESVSREQAGSSRILGSGVGWDFFVLLAIHVLSGFLLEQPREYTRSPSPKAFPAHRVGGQWAKAEKGCVAALYLWEGVREKMLCGGNETWGHESNLCVMGLDSGSSPANRARVHFLKQ